MTPDDRRYAKTHEWIKMEGLEAIVGISDHAQEALGDITFVELPALGDTAEQGREVGVIESVKAASDLFSPVSGTISAVNDELEGSPELINEDPYGKGWIFKVKDVEESQLDDLMDGPQYEAMLDEQEGEE